MLRFQNDYSEGAHPNVLRALCDTNLSATPGYGLDDDCRRAADAIRARFACPDADVHFLVGGTQTNLLAAAAFLRPWEAMVAARRSRCRSPAGACGRRRGRTRSHTPHNRAEQIPPAHRHTR